MSESNGFKAKNLSEEDVAALLIAQKKMDYFDMAGNIMVAINKNEKIIAINKKGYEILGYPQGTLIGKKWLDVCLPKEQRRKVRIAFSKLIKGKIKGYEQFENEILTKSNEKRIIKWHNSLIRDDDQNIVGTLSSGDDITEIRNFERQLIEKERELDTIFNASPNFIIHKDVNDKIVNTNLEFSRFMGTTRDKLIGKTTFEVLKDKNVAKKVREEDLEVIKTGKPKQSLLGFFTSKKTGKNIWGIYTKKPYFNHKGEITGTLTIVTDITERKKAEDELNKIISILKDKRD
jgi:PAS domain S-box-containing protein